MDTSKWDQTAQVRELIQKLQNQPVPPADVAVQFQLFVNYLQTTVESTRRHVVEFAASCQPKFQDVRSLHIHKGIDEIDQHQNIAVCETAGRWIICDMLMQAACNNGLLLELLRHIRSEFQMFINERECPVCFEAMHETSSTVVLKCCHSVLDVFLAEFELALGHGMQPLGA